MVFSDFEIVSGNTTPFQYSEQESGSEYEHEHEYVLLKRKGSCPDLKKIGTPMLKRNNSCPQLEKVSDETLVWSFEQDNWVVESPTYNKIIESDSEYESNYVDYYELLKKNFKNVVSKVTRFAIKTVNAIVDFFDSIYSWF